MWPVNYDDINKFHLSVGVGLLVAGFLLFITTYVTFQESINEALGKVVCGFK